MYGATSPTVPRTPPDPYLAWPLPLVVCLLWQPTGGAAEPQALRFQLAVAAVDQNEMSRDRDDRVLGADHVKRTRTGRTVDRQDEVCSGKLHAADPDDVGSPGEVDERNHLGVIRAAAEKRGTADVRPDGKADRRVVRRARSR
jgi:hypothetical protein